MEYDTTQRRQTSAKTHKTPEQITIRYIESRTSRDRSPVAGKGQDEADIKQKKSVLLLGWRVNQPTIPTNSTKSP